MLAALQADAHALGGGADGGSAVMLWVRDAMLRLAGGGMARRSFLTDAADK